MFCNSTFCAHPIRNARGGWGARLRHEPYSAARLVLVQEAGEREIANPDAVRETCPGAWHGRQDTRWASSRPGAL